MYRIFENTKQTVLTSSNEWIDSYIYPINAGTNELGMQNAHEKIQNYNQCSQWIHSNIVPLIWNIKEGLHICSRTLSPVASSLRNCHRRVDRRISPIITNAREFIGDVWNELSDRSTTSKTIRCYAIISIAGAVGCRACYDLSNLPR